MSEYGAETGGIVCLHIDDKYIVFLGTRTVYLVPIFELFIPYDRKMKRYLKLKLFFSFWHPPSFKYENCALPG